ncbi:hypothetical protein CANTEDRAFT_98619 [Yamadazyma tenuis ATCC 10573]|uniref:F-box domain-containing protein n=3 Tax=Candida tenuis TaxID=2315449 RepID=G3BA05_CANTC|nr:uncharacterized protein CANTEDRAFT_98619 [Yamadazyma tenuis ATCC 10573]EGV61367.1 hypothetical protein CANTEDRAFT_98619 [Yamadazyma tenuis ATCC 10573]
MFDRLPTHLIEEIFQYVNQFDLLNLSLVCSQFYGPAIGRLYKRITVVLNGEFPVRYKNKSNLFIQENGIKYMDSALIFKPQNLMLLLDTLKRNKTLVSKVNFFVFDKCNSLKVDNIPVGFVQNQIMDFFGANSSDIHFLHITFIEFFHCIDKLTEFLRNNNVRNKVFKLFVTKLNELYIPCVPQNLTNLFLMLDESELADIDEIDLSSAPYNLFYSLFTLACSTNNQLGLEVLSKIKLLDPELKLNLKGLTLFHCHKESIMGDEEGNNSDPVSFNSNILSRPELMNFFDGIDKRLRFDILDSKINVASLTTLHLKIDCNEHRYNSCNCFSQFFMDFTKYSEEHDGLPNLTNFEVELFPNLEWLRPHQILENNLTPLSTFVTSLSSLSRLTIDLSTPGFKMFDNSMGMTSFILNRLNERLMEAFFLRFFTTGSTRTRLNLKTLHLPDFLTSFIYYKPDFYKSLLHTCKCWGCQLLLNKLKDLFHPLIEDDDDDDDDEEDDEARSEEMDIQSTYYILIGFILGKLQADREVCVPIKQNAFNYRNYPIYKGAPHTLHSHFHTSNSGSKCKCGISNGVADINEDPNGLEALSIDNLVTTYVVHQLKPIVEFLPSFFVQLDSLMIHGIYYEKQGSGMVPIFDEQEYPCEFLAEKDLEIRSGSHPDLPFGKFRK